MLLTESVLIYPVKKTNSIDYYRVYVFNFFPEKALHPATPRAAGLSWTATLMPSPCP